MKQYKISEEILMSILGYLKTRPYQEVFSAIPVLQSLEEIREEQPVPEDLSGDNS